MPVPLTMEESYPTQFLAMKLNNRAASLLITHQHQHQHQHQHHQQQPVKYYEEGITLLTKALRLTQKPYTAPSTSTQGQGQQGQGSSATTTTTSSSSRCCKFCTFQSCLLMDHDTYCSSLMIDHHHQEAHQEAKQEAQHQGSHQHNHMITTTKNNEVISMNKIESSCTTSTSTSSSTSIDFDEELKFVVSSVHQESSSTSSCYQSMMMTSTLTGQAQSQSQDATTATTTTTNQYGFVYRRPILINKHCIDEMHVMVGDTLSLIVLFNLALAHQLKAIAMSMSMSMPMPMPMPISSSAIDTAIATAKTASKKIKTKSVKSVFSQALQLYELVYQLHSSSNSNSNSNSNNNTDHHFDCDDDDDDATKCASACDDDFLHLRFIMIVSNNIGEIHRLVGDKDKHHMCLQHLLCALMYMVDYNLTNTSTNTDTNTAASTTINNSSYSSQQTSTSTSSTLTEMMDGFYYNLSQIMLKNDVCAKAA